MKYSNWKDIAEFVGIAAIVVSLVFVGLQMKQSQEIAIAAQYHARAALSVENFSSEMESGDLHFWESFLGPIEILVPESLLLRKTYIRAVGC